MKITNFKINNYRAIEEINFKLNFSINPIIGINEAGKTSVLKAILAFDRTRDKINRGEHLEFKNKYTIGTQKCSISATINLDKNEVKKFIEKLNLKTDSEDYKILSKINEKFDFTLTRHLSNPDKNYSCVIDGTQEKTLDKITKYLVSNLPYILYFDDFADRVPEEIEFPADYRNTTNLGRGKDREWKEIIQEIFKRADTEGIGESENENHLISYLKFEDEDTKDDILSDVEDTLNKEIIKEWKRIKKSGKSFADDSDKLELVIVNHENTFKFKVKDKSHKDKKRTFDISERSKGFQWFFNYMIKLKFNPNYKGKLENSIFLLDEPGSYLHSSAQSELLNELQTVSKKNIIIYCTHSQYLLNPDVIKLGSIKIAEKKSSQITLQNYGNYKSTKNKGALSPIYQALQLNFAHDFIGKIVITEGITDYYLLSIIQKHTNLIAKDIKIIPSSGASQSSTLISIAIPFSENFVIFLDNDKAGIAAKKKYIKEFGEQISNHLHIYKSDESKYLLEDYLCSKDTENLLKITKSEDPKRALGFLFYDYKNNQKDFVKNLSKESLNNLSDITKRIKSI
ncbi:AAA family ATPase [Flavobacteriaceae bacterium F08102]|nr:AAA family ATPase [Flavobacteriaceae bacterium F08102]